MRERLIELLNECRGIEGVGMELMRKKADYLLANGVIVPPCKVGDTVYYISGFNGCEKICGKEVKSIWFDNEGLVFTVRGMYMDFCVPENELYITREEAEKELERMKSNA
jgi:hypothetical protein